MTSPLSLIAITLALLLVLALGRGVERHTTLPAHPPMFATSLCAGLGLWTLLWLAFVPMGGGHTKVLVPLALLLALGLAGKHLMHWARDKSEEEHYWSLPIVHTLLLAPWLPLLVVMGPSTLDDFASLQTITTLAANGAWPTGGAQPFGQGTPGWHIFHQLPALATAATGRETIPATFMLPLIMLLGVGCLLPAFTGTRVKWSNLPLVAAPALLVALAFAPLALPLPAATPGLLMAPLALAIGALPLLRPGPLQTGWPTLPHALALAWLAAIHPLGLPVAMVVAGLFVVVGLWRKAPFAGVVFSATASIVLPLAVVLMFAATLSPWHSLSVATSAATMESLSAWVPWPLEGPWWHNLLHLLSLTLLALPARLLNGIYQTSSLARATHGHPWLYAAPVVAAAVAAALALKPLVITVPAPIITYAQQVAVDVQAKKLVPPQAQVAVVGLPPLAAAALAYHLPHAIVAQVSDTLPLSTFHATLRNQGYPLVWVGSQAAQGLFGLPDAPSASLFAQTTAEGLVIRAIYPMPQSR